jgi:hypothetical protein
MTNWIMGCVTYSSFVVLLNGEVTYFFKSRKDLRQGCPLSPLIFILVMEGINILLKSNILDGNLKCIKVSRLMKLLHILFLNNVLIMTKKTLKEWMEVVNIL